jgi:hypothetical protein
MRWEPACQENHTATSPDAACAALYPLSSCISQLDSGCDLRSRIVDPFSSLGTFSSSNGGARESTQGAKGICNPIGGTTLWTNQYPGVLDSSCICIKRWPSRPSLQREAHWTCKLYMPQYRGTAGPKRGSGWGRGVGGRVWGTFGIALEM